MLQETNCTYAHVPYRIADYQKTLENPTETIEFDDQLDRMIDGQVEIMGSDGKLVQSRDGSIYHATMLEKLILPGLVKMTNFVPGGGIWLNTQRPEWNDANNALVGNGMSVVTVCYLRRYFNFLIDWFSQVQLDEALKVSAGVSQLVLRIHEVLSANEHLIATGIMTDANRKSVVDALSQAGSDHRRAIYDGGVAELSQALPLSQCVDLFKRCVAFLDSCIASNRRGDGLYHSYNLMRWGNDSIKVERLAEMLEGQVAVITSNALSLEQVCDVLDALRASQLYRQDQESYILYPDRQLPRFSDKNVINSDLVNQSELLLTMLRDGNVSIVKRDIAGIVRFHADLRNVECLHGRLKPLRENPRYATLVENEWDLVSRIYEQTFRHHRFTGRSENFFAYEGLGSIYWHMVSKLALAALEQYADATAGSNNVSSDVIQRLKQHYIEVREGLGVNKTPAHFGAFPTDPYSHTPAHAGAQQPGMTGQVKEDVLCRMLEIGARVRNGRVVFEPLLFNPDEFQQYDERFEFIALDGSDQRLELQQGQFAWTWCQVPIVYHRSSENGLEVHLANGETATRSELQLTEAETASLFSRDKSVARIDVRFDPSKWVGGSA